MKHARGYGPCDMNHVRRHNLDMMMRVLPHSKMMSYSLWYHPYTAMNVPRCVPTTMRDGARVAVENVGGNSLGTVQQ